MGRQRGDGSLETSGVDREWQRRGRRERRSAIDGQPQDAGPENRQPFPSPSGADGRSVVVASRRMGAKRPGLSCHRQGEAFHSLFRRFATTSSFANPLPVLGRHLHALSFLIIRDFKTLWTVPGTFPSTSGSRILLPVQHPRLEM